MQGILVSTSSSTSNQKQDFRVNMPKKNQVVPHGSFSKWVPLVSKKVITPVDFNLGMTLRSGQNFRWIPCAVEDTGATSRANCAWAGFAGGSFYQLMFRRTSKPGSNENVLHFRKLESSSSAPRIASKLKPQHDTSVLTAYFSLDLNLDALMFQWTQGEMCAAQQGAASIKKSEAAAAPIHPLVETLRESNKKRQSHGKGKNGVPSSSPDAIRLLRQDPHECLFSFICSQNNHVKRIAAMIDKLCTAYGTPVVELQVPVWDDLVAKSAVGTTTGLKRKRGMRDADETATCGDGGEPTQTVAKCIHAFPTIEELVAKATEEELRALGFGYRAAYVVQCAASIHQSAAPSSAKKALAKPATFYDALLASDEATCRAQLMALHGVGRKVADCIMVFSLGHRHLVPIDTHMLQVTLRVLQRGKRAKAMQLTTDETHNKVLLEVGEKASRQQQANKQLSLLPKYHDAFQCVYREAFGAEAGWAHSFLFEQRINK